MVSESDGYMRIRKAASWRETLKRDLDPSQGIPAVLNKRKALDGWELLRGAPNGRAGDEFGFAVTIAMADFDNPLVSACLTRCLEVVRAGDNDPRWSSWWAVTRNITHGMLMGYGALAEAWLEKVVPEQQKLALAADEILTGALHERPSWGDFAQAEYLHGIQLLLISGAHDEARSRLERARQPVPPHYYWTWHLELLATMDRPSAARALFDEYFDELRDPRFRAPSDGVNRRFVLMGNMALVRLRLALIRWIYIERQPIAGNWRNIIAQIGY